MNAAVPLRAVGRRRAPWVGTVVLTLVTVLVTAYAVVSMRLILSDSLTAPPAKIFNYWDHPSCISGSFGTAMLNSTIVAVATVDIGIVMAIFTAFALSWLHFRFRELIFGLVVISFLTPFRCGEHPAVGDLPRLGAVELPHRTHPAGPRQRTRRVLAAAILLRDPP